MLAAPVIALCCYPAYLIIRTINLIASYPISVISWGKSENNPHYYY